MAAFHHPLIQEACPLSDPSLFSLWGLLWWRPEAKRLTDHPTAQFTGEWSTPLHWRHNEHNSVSNHQRLDCLLNCLFRLRSKKTPKLRVTGICGEFSGDRWIPRAKGQWRGKCFQLMTSSWWLEVWRGVGRHLWVRIGNLLYLMNDLKKKTVVMTNDNWWFFMYSCDWSELDKWVKN